MLGLVKQNPNNKNIQNNRKSIKKYTKNHDISMYNQKANKGHLSTPSH